jgi:hypothetical protein
MKPCMSPVVTDRAFVRFVCYTVKVTPAELRSNVL